LQNNLGVNRLCIRAVGRKVYEKTPLSPRLGYVPVVFMVAILRLILVAIIGVVFLGGVPFIVHGEEFYKDKSIKFIVGYSPGGLFDTFTRLIGRHFSKHVSGNPIVIVDNMTGAGGIILGNYLYHQAKPDGLTIGAWATPLVLQQLMGTEAIKFDGRKFGYLGAPGAEDAVCALNEASGIKTAEEWFTAKRPVKIGAIAPGTSTSDVPKLVHAAIKLPMQIVEGFKGGAEARLAVETGELDGYCGSWQSVKLAWRQAVNAGKIRLVLQLTLKPHREIEHVPLAINYAKSDEARKLLRIISVYRNPYIYSVPPSTPKDRLQILQKAFMSSIGNAELLSDAKKSNLEIEPIDGPTIANSIESLYELDSATIAKLKEILVVRK
jgi:tripartite-type tricarboxylate transporter receptor subunit TctC